MTLDEAVSAARLCQRWRARPDAPCAARLEVDVQRRGQRVTLTPLTVATPDATHIARSPFAHLKALDAALKHSDAVPDDLALRVVGGDVVVQARLHRDWPDARVVASLKRLAAIADALEWTLSQGADRF